MRYETNELIIASGRYANGDTMLVKDAKKCYYCKKDITDDIYWLHTHWTIWIMIHPPVAPSKHFTAYCSQECVVADSI